jgi:hypothetical protein
VICRRRPAKDSPAFYRSDRDENCRRLFLLLTLGG